MAGTKLPYMKWYPQLCDTDETVKSMTDEEFGFYMRCLNHAWINGSLPADLSMLARALVRPLEYVERIWVMVGKTWTPKSSDPSRLVNPKQEELRNEVETKSEKARRSVRIKEERKAFAERSQSDRHPTDAVRASNSNSYSFTDTSNTEEKPREEESHRKPVLAASAKTPERAPVVTFPTSGANALAPRQQHSVNPFDLWREITAVYPQGFLGSEELGKAVFLNYISDHMGREREFVDAIIAGIVAWKETERWKHGFVLEIKNFIANRVWEKSPPPPVGKRASTFREAFRQTENNPAEDDDLAEYTPPSITREEFNEHVAKTRADPTLTQEQKSKREEFWKTLLRKED